MTRWTVRQDETKAQDACRRMTRQKVSLLQRQNRQPSRCLSAEFGGKGQKQYSSKRGRQGK